MPYSETDWWPSDGSFSGSASNWDAPPWRLQVGDTYPWLAANGVADNGVDYSGQTVYGRFWSNDYGSDVWTTQTLPPGDPAPEPGTGTPAVPGVGLEVTGATVAAASGMGDDAETVALLGQTLDSIRWMAYAYTRGRGFDVEARPLTRDLVAVLRTATIRLGANPEQLPYDVGGTNFRGGFTGWSLGELAVLNRYRKRAS